jgi:DNA polymerase
MIRIDKAGLTIVGHVHDECIIEVKAKDVEKVLPKFQELMTTLPEWAQGLPVVAHAWTNDRYTK